MVWHGAARCCIVQNSAARRSTVRHGAAWCGGSWGGARVLEGAEAALSPELLNQGSSRAEEPATPCQRWEAGASPWSGWRAPGDELGPGAAPGLDVPHHELSPPLSLGGCRAAMPVPRGPRPGSASQHRTADGSPGLQHCCATSEPPCLHFPPCFLSPPTAGQGHFLQAADPRHIAACRGNLIRLNHQNAT